MPAAGSSTATIRPRYARECECHALLADGSVVTVRPIRPDDAGALDYFHEHLSAETVYKRFFNAHPHLRAEEIQRFTGVDYQRRLALIAERDGQLVGVARYDARPDDDAAEVAFVIADALQGHGLGTLLLEHLVAAARHRGIQSLVADTLATNSQMQDVFRQVGFARESHWADGVVNVTFPIAPTQAYLDAILGRHFSSVAAWLSGRSQHIGTGALGVVCRSHDRADSVIESARYGGVGLSSVIVTDDASAGLAALATHHDSTAVAVDLDDLALPRRFVVVARAVGREKPVVAFDPDGRFAGVCQQAGVERVASPLDGLVDADRRTWPVLATSKRGSLVDLPGCNPGRARKVLDRATARSGTVDDLVELDPGAAGELLDSYGVGTSVSLAAVVGDEVGTLSARSARAVTRLLPLTDRDAEDVAPAHAETVLRVARLVEDQPELRRAEIGPDGPRVWAGPSRGSDDDPFVRRLRGNQ